MAQGLSSRLTERSTLSVLAPAAAFWAGGLAALYWQDDSSLWGWGLANLVTDEPQWLQDRLPRLFELTAFEQFVVLIGVVVPSALVAQRFVLPLLRLAEGYLPGWLEFLRKSLIRRQQKRVDRARARYEPLRDAYDGLTVVQRREYRRLDRQLEGRTPQGALELMPTELGNILRAAETRPKDKYGLDVLICWPRLWLLLPESAAKELDAARSGLDAGTRICLWGILFLIWSVWAWWAIPAGLAVVVLSYRSMLAAASTYGTLLESAFDVYRGELYKRVLGRAGFDPGQEPGSGRRLTQYLWRRLEESASASPVETSAAAPSPANSDDGQRPSAPGAADPVGRDAVGPEHPLAARGDDAREES